MSIIVCSHDCKYEVRNVKHLLFLWLLIFSSQEAQADCMARAEQRITAKIDKVYASVYDGAGYQQSGCILESDGKVLGFTSYNYLCHLPPGEKVDLRLSYGCCDTGPDSGDLVCTVRAREVGSLVAVHGNGIGLLPTEKDVRAINDLVDVLQGDFVFSYYGASKKILEYFADDKFREDVLGKKERLKTIAKQGNRPDQRAYVSYVLLSMDNQSEAEAVDQIVSVLQMRYFSEDITVPVIEIAGNYPGSLDKIAPVLLDFLKENYYTNEDAMEAAFRTLEKFDKLLRPYMLDLLEFEFAWSDSYHDFKHRVEYYKRMNKIVCSISPEDTNTLAWHGAPYRNPPKARFTCPPAGD